MMEYLLRWLSGHRYPLPIYYMENAEGWCGTFNRSEAKRFPTKAAAEQAWRDMHRFPEDYEHCLAECHARAELADQPELPIAS